MSHYKHIAPEEREKILLLHSQNCTLPKWLSDKAESLGINFSKTLQEALLTKIEEL